VSKAKFIPSLLIIMVLVAACTDPGSGDTSTSTAVSSTTIASDASGATTSTSASAGTSTATNNRPLEVVDCVEPAEEVAIVCEAYDLINEHYVDPVEDEALAEAATLALTTLDGNDSDDVLVCVTPTEAFASTCDTAADAADSSAEAAEMIVAGFAAYGLDPNSAYLDVAALDLLQEEQEGAIEGIGALVSAEDENIPGDNKQCGIVSETCRILIVSTISGAPADDAGLERDDVLVEVDGASIVGWTVDEVTSAVRGPSGTDVTLTLERNGETFDVTITRAAVVIPVVETETIGDVGYVRLTSFTGTAGSQFETAVVDLLADGVDALVIDLRNNPGGFLTTAIDVTSVFLNDGDVVVTEGPGDSTTYPVDGDAIIPDDVNVYFVVNKGSASASEVVAATLQERNAAVIVGESTFGKNTVQQRFNLSNGGALKLTIARWLTPERHDFGGTGVTPDVSIDVTDLTTEELVAAVTGTG
jgi:carboxyl-terminal processing protease